MLILKKMIFGGKMKQLRFFCIIAVIITVFCSCNNERRRMQTERMAEITARHERLKEREKEIPTNIPVLLEDQRFNGVFVSVFLDTFLRIDIFDGTNKCIHYAGQIPFSEPSDIKPSNYQFDVTENEIIEKLWEDKPGLYDEERTYKYDSSSKGTYNFNEDGSRFTVKWEDLSGNSMVFVKFPPDAIPDVMDSKTLQSIWYNYKVIMGTNTY